MAMPAWKVLVHYSVDILTAFDVQVVDWESQLGRLERCLEPKWAVLVVGCDGLLELPLQT
jgi:hypothetical protein